MQSQTIHEVERLLRTEMDDMEQFYRQFGEDDSPGSPPNAPARPLPTRDPGALKTAAQSGQSRAGEAWNDVLRNSTRFMKSGDFFDYIENMVEQDVRGAEPPRPDEPKSEPKAEEVIDPKQISEKHLDLSQARNLDVEMNIQSTFIDQQKRVPMKRARPVRNPEVKAQAQMAQIQEESENQTGPESDEPVKKSERVSIDEPSWKRDHAFGKSTDERVISTKKKTFEQMLEEALKKEGQSFVDVAPAPVTRKKTNFLKKNTSRRRFLNKKSKNLSKYGRPNFKKKAKAKKEEKKAMTESMLEFQQMEQINGRKSEDEAGELERVPSIEEKSREDSGEEPINYEYLKMGEEDREEEDTEEEEDRDQDRGKVSEARMRREIEKVKKQVEDKFKRKIEELNREIRKYKKRNKDLEEDKKKIAKLKRKVEDRKAEVEQLKADKADFENYKQKEMEKIKREKALTKRNAKAYRATTNKKDKETIDNLKREMRILREQGMAKEKKLKDALERRKRKIEELRNDNEELRGQVDFYEKMRLQRERKKEQKEPSQRDSPDESPEESGEESGEESEGEGEQPVKSLKAAVESLSKQKGKDKKEMKRFFSDFYAGFENPVPNVDKGTLKINNENYKYDENTHFKKYKWNQENDLEVVKEEESEGKIYKTFSNGRKEIKFSNGAVKEIMPDGYIIGTRPNRSALREQRHQADSARRNGDILLLGTRDNADHAAEQQSGHLPVPECPSRVPFQKRKQADQVPRRDGEVRVQERGGVHGLRRQYAPAGQSRRNQGHQALGISPGNRSSRGPETLDQSQLNLIFNFRKMM